MQPITKLDKTHDLDMPADLDALDRRYLAMVADRPVGIEAICAGLAEDRSTIEDVVEPFLMQSGLIARGGRGRVATDAGRAHLTGEEHGA